MRLPFLLNLLLPTIAFTAHTPRLLGRDLKPASATFPEPIPEDSPGELNFPDPDPDTPSTSVNNLHPIEERKGGDGGGHGSSGDDDGGVHGGGGGAAAAASGGTKIDGSTQLMSVLGGMGTVAIMVS